jgi:hypothetical protein
MSEGHAVYGERNRLVAFLSRLYPSHLALHPDDPSWEQDWLTIVCIHSPAGQLTWHIHDSEVPIFYGLAMQANDWDGHTTDQKYARLAALPPEVKW